MLVGLAVTSWALGLGETGYVFLLVSPIMGIALLGAVLVGELLARAPAPGPARRALLETRRVADYLPPSARVVGALLGVYGVLSLAAATPGAGSGVVVRTCGDMYGPYGRWPAAPAVVFPALAVVLLGLTVAAVALRRLVDRPRPTGVPVEADDEARRATAAAVVAACAVLVTGPLCVTAAGLGTDLMDGCGVLDPGAGLMLLWLAGAAVLVAGWALLALLAPPRRERA